MNSTEHDGGGRSPSQTNVSRDVVQGQFGDLLRRMDHHARILQRASVEFFKAMALAQAGGIISVITILFTVYSRANDPARQASTTTFRTLGPQYAVLSESAQLILVLLLIGLFCSLLGSALMYLRHNNRTEYLRGHINDVLFEGKPIQKIEWRTPTVTTRFYAAVAVLSVATFAGSVLIAVHAIYKIL